MRILLTGFEPFGGETVNPSQKLVEVLSAERLPGVQLIGVILPVVYQSAEPRLAATIDDLEPDYVLSFGQAGGSSALRIERVGINVRLTLATDPAITSSPVAGSFQLVHSESERTFLEAPVIPDGPPAFFSTLPVWDIYATLRRIGIPASQSYAAGTHLCNSTLYYTLHHLATCPHAHTTRAGFIHVPLLPQQAARIGANGRDTPPSMELETMIRGVRAVLYMLAGEESNS